MKARFLFIVLFSSVMTLIITWGGRQVSTLAQLPDASAATQEDVIRSSAMDLPYTRPDSVSENAAINVLAHAKILPGDPARLAEGLATDQEHLSQPLLTMMPDSPGDATSLSGEIAFESNRFGDYDLFTQQATGSVAEPLVTHYSNDTAPVWSPDGTNLVFASDRDGDFDIYLRTATGLEINLTNNAAEDIHPSWSPDGQRILFSSNQDDFYFQIYSINSDGQDLRRHGVVAGNALYPHYSPDGARITYMRASILLAACDWNWDVWVMDATGFNQVRVTSQLGGDLYPSWTPDGSQIIYAKCEFLYSTDLYTINPNTGTESQITDSFSSNEWGAAFSPDATYLAFNTNIEGDTEIYIGPTAGGTATNFTSHTAEDLAPSWREENYTLSAITGQVVDEDGHPFALATLYNSNGDVANPDIDGVYTFPNLPPGVYTITASLGSFMINPPWRTIAVPPSRVGQDFVAVDCQNATAQSPLLLVPGWGAADTVYDDKMGFDALLPHLESAGYVLNCNLFYAGDTSADKSIDENAVVIRNALCDAYPMVEQLVQGWNGEFDIIAHSYGGLRSRGYLENPDLSDMYCPGTNHQIQVKNLFTLGTPHGGGYPDLIGALGIALGHLMPDEWVSIWELLPFNTRVYNRSHNQPIDVCYRTIGGNAWAQPNTHAIFGAFYAPPQKLIPNDLGVYRFSAHALDLFWSHKYPHVITPSTDDMHGYINLTPFPVDSFFYPYATFDTHIADYIGKGMDQCMESQQNAVLATEAVTVPPPVPANLLASDVIDNNGTQTGTFQISEGGRSTMYLNWPLGDMEFTLESPDGSAINPTTDAGDSNFHYVEMDLLASVATYVFTDTLTGTWNYTVTAQTISETTPYRLIVLPEMPVAVTAVAQDWQPFGQPVHITGTLSYSATTPIVDGTVQATLSRPDGSLDTLDLFDDGLHNDQVAGDGVYGNSYSSTNIEGFYGVVVSATGVYQSQSYVRTAETAFSIGPMGTAITGQYSEQPRDANEDGFYEALDISVAVNLQQADKYLLSADLLASDGTFISYARREIEATSGLQNFGLSFPGEEIYSSRQDGPYQVTNVHLFRGDKIKLLADYTSDSYWTAVYNYEDFAEPPTVYLPVIVKD